MTLVWATSNASSVRFHATSLPPRLRRSGRATGEAGRWTTSEWLRFPQRLR